jgi:ethanolamine utilization protein EutQ (cupin superfamily)
MNIMSIAAASRYQTPSANEPVASQLSEEDFDKLQEIHELISLMLKELPARPQGAAQPYFASAMPISPYTHAYLPWGVSPYVTPPNF